MGLLRRAVALLMFLTLLVILAVSLPFPAIPPHILADGDVLLLPVDFEGKRYQFLLDTGATNTVYDSTFRSRLGNFLGKERVKTPQGDVQASCFQAPEASVGKMSLRTNEPVICANLKNFREALGVPIMGIVGLDFLRQHRIRLDFDAGKLEFIDSVEAEPGTPIPLILRRCYHAKASVAGEEEEFKIDTGSVGDASGDLEAKLCERLIQAQKLKKVSRGLTISLSGIFEEQTLALNDFGLGPFTHHQLCFSQGRKNILGLRYLSRYVVTFDFPSQKMYLKKGKWFDQPDSRNRNQSGLHIISTDGPTIVKIVDSGSPAARAGIEPKDILLKLDKLNADKTRLHVLRQRLARENETVHLRLRRGDEERELDLKLGK